MQSIGIGGIYWRMRIGRARKRGQCVSASVLASICGWLVFRSSEMQSGGRRQCWTANAGADLRAGRVLKCPPRTGAGLRLHDANELSFQSRGRRSSPFIYEPFRIMFCWIPKVACTKYKQLFMKMALHQNWSNKDHVHSLEPNVQALQTFTHELEYVNDVIEDPRWLRVVVLRDPFERFMSAYLNKVVQSKCSMLGRKCSLKATAADVEVFLKTFPWKDDRHFGLQREFCGFEKYRPIWNRVALYGHNIDLQATTSALFDGLLDVPISHGWGTRDAGMWTALAANETKSQQPQLLCEICRNAKVFTMVMDSYMPDYEFFQLPVPNICSSCRPVA